MKARYYVWGALGGLAVASAPGTPLWVLPGLGLCAHLAFDERPDLLAQALPLLAQAGQHARLALPAVRRALEGAESVDIPAPAQRPAQVEPGPPQPTNPLGMLGEQLEATPHRLIIGHTRGGKTTLIHDMATRWAGAGERVLVCDPDAAPGLWPGCEVAGAGDDLVSIGHLLEQVRIEVAARRQARAKGVRRFAPLHLVVDEAQDVFPDIEGAQDLFEDIARRGGKLNVRLTVGVQDKQVKTLGLEGKSDLLRNLQVADVMKNRQGERVAVLRDAETGQKVSYAIPNLADPETLIQPVAKPRTGQTDRLHPDQAVPPDLRRRRNAEQDPLLASLLASGVPSHQDAKGTAVNPIPGNGINEPSSCSSVTVEGTEGAGVTVNVTQVAPQAGRKNSADRTAYTAALEALYEALGAEGVPFAKSYAQHKGTKEIAFTAWQRGRNRGEGANK